MAATGAKAVPARNPRQKRRNQLPTGCRGQVLHGHLCNFYTLRAAQRVTCRSYKDVRVELALDTPWGAGYASSDVGFGLARPSHRSPPSRGAEDGNRSSVTGTLADLHDRTTISES